MPTAPTLPSPGHAPAAVRPPHLALRLPTPEPPRLDDADAAALVVHLAAYAMGVSAHEVGGVTRRGAGAARARQVAMYLAHTAFSWPLTRVAAAFGRDRSTVSHACGRVEDWRDDAGFDAKLGELEACLQAAPPRGALAMAGRA